MSSPFFNAREELNNASICKCPFCVSSCVDLNPTFYDFTGEYRSAKNGEIVYNRDSKLIMVGFNEPNKKYWILKKISEDVSLENSSKAKEALNTIEIFKAPLTFEQLNKVSKCSCIYCNFSINTHFAFTGEKRSPKLNEIYLNSTLDKITRNKFDGEMIALYILREVKQELPLTENEEYTASLIYAKQLANTLYEKYYKKDVPNWQVGEELINGSFSNRYYDYRARKEIK